MMKPSMTCVSTFGFIIAFGKSFSTFAIVAPGVVFGGGPLFLLPRLLLIELLVVVIFAEVVVKVLEMVVLVFAAVVIEVVQLVDDVVLTAGKLDTESSGDEDTTDDTCVVDLSLSFALGVVVEALSTLEGELVVPSVVGTVANTVALICLGNETDSIGDSVVSIGCTANCGVSVAVVVIVVDAVIAGDCCMVMQLLVAIDVTEVEIVDGVVDMEVVEDSVSL